MDDQNQTDKTAHFIEAANEFGASLAGIVSVACLQDAPSHQVRGGAGWPADAKSVLVVALAHERSELELDWWDPIDGGSPGINRLVRLTHNLGQWLKAEFNVNARPLAYSVAAGGVFLKDAAALAGLGIIGRNNLLITPQYGPRVRLRALFLDVKLQATGPTCFDPCDGCDMPCRRACPQAAFRDGAYGRSYCNVQMETDEANEVLVESRVEGGSPGKVVKYCRACELACPVPRRERTAV